MKGHLDISCARDAAGRPYLREQSFRAPLHLSKPHRDAGSLVVNLVNPTAGVFDDDEIAITARVEDGASLLLTTPSSCRVYRSRDGSHARALQHFEVATGGFLEFYPEPFIPHAGARYRQETRIDVAAGGAAAYFEWITPGRVARGEAFEYESLEWATDLTAAGLLVARERFRLQPGDDSLSPLVALFPRAHYLGCFVVGGDDPPAREVNALSSDTVFAGCGPLRGGAGWTAKAICADALTARRTLATLRQITHRALGTRPARLARF